MLCYRDKTYCPYWQDCRDGDACTRALTDAVKLEAEKLCVMVSMYGCEPGCYQEKGKHD